MADSGIYEIWNRVNGKRYVGSAVNFAQRWREHRSGLCRGKHHSSHLQAAWNKHGEVAFEFRVLMECAPDDLLREEQAEFDRRRPEYNICPTAGSTLGRAHSDETKRKIAARHIGTKRPPRSAEYRAKISAIHKGRQPSPEHMAALQAGRAKRVYTEEQRQQIGQAVKSAYAEGRKDRSRSPEYREKIAATLRGRELSPEHRANVSAAMRGKKRGPYKLDPAKAEARRESGRRFAASNVGRKMPDHVKEALRLANKDRKISDDQRQKMSENMLKSWTPERKAKQAAAMRAHHQRRKATGPV